MVEDKEEGNVHNTYYFELELYQIIKNGNTDALKKFLSATRAPLKEGKMAGAPLRHAKNLFISAVVSQVSWVQSRAVWISKKHTSS